MEEKPRSVGIQNQSMKGSIGISWKKKATLAKLAKIGGRKCRKPLEFTQEGIVPL